MKARFGLRAELMQKTLSNRSRVSAWKELSMDAQSASINGVEIPQLPEGCGYQGYEFGARYPDSICFGGRLYDADDCDNAGNYYDPGEVIPCPMCDRKGAVEYHTRTFSSGTYKERLNAARSLVDDIRKNRKNGTEPWKAK
jgi:hypothetical protein